MNGVNLIPAGRLYARRRTARLHLWVGIAPACAVMLAGLYGYLLMTWDTATTPLSSQELAVESEVSAARARLTQARLALSESNRVLAAKKAVGDQPDWGLLLALLADKTGPEVVLSACLVGAEVGAARPQARSDRPNRHLVAVDGYSLTQDGVSRFVLDLEQTGVFDAVKLVESRRAPVFSVSAVTFRIECVIGDGSASADAGGGETR